MTSISYQLLFGINWIISGLSSEIIINPTTVQQYASVSLTDDPRNINQVINNTYWYLSQPADNQLHDWYVYLSLWSP